MVQNYVGYDEQAWYEDTSVLDIESWTPEPEQRCTCPKCMTARSTTVPVHFYTSTPQLDYGSPNAPHCDMCADTLPDVGVVYGLCHDDHNRIIVVACCDWYCFNRLEKVWTPTPERKNRLVKMLAVVTAVVWTLAIIL